jgi:hypothetical protein
VTWPGGGAPGICLTTANHGERPLWQLLSRVCQILSALSDSQERKL